VAVRTALTAGLIASPWRAGCSLGLAALLLAIGTDSLQNAVALGDTRTLSLHNIHTKEDLTVVYKRGGRYDDEAMKKLNRFLRDWRLDKETTMDPKVIDILWEVHRDVGAQGPVHIVCGYRSPGTNAMLRKRSRGVAQFSRHMSGQAIDYFIPGVPIEQVRNAGLRLQRGGVGYYPSSGVAFVHMDIGSVRHWPRVPEQQMARILSSRTSVAMAKPAAEEPKRSIFPNPFKLPTGDDEDEEASTPTATPAAPAKRGRMPAVASRTPSPPAAEAEPEKPVPLPPTRPAGKQPTTFQVASAPPPARPVEAPKPKTFQIAGTPPTAEHPIEPPKPASAPTFQFVATSSAPAPERLPWPAPPEQPPAGAVPAPSDVISTRALWQGPVPPVPPAEIPNVPPARHPDAIESAATGSLAPWPMPSQKRDTDRVPAELALAYATQSEDKDRKTTPARAAPMGAVAARAPVAAPVVVSTPGASPASTVAIKQPVGPARLVQPAPAPAVAAVAPAKVAIGLGNPWLRAMITTPSAQNFMTTMTIGANDFRSLRPFLQKPPSSVVMTFSDDPTPGLEIERFTGEAIVFVSTVTFSTRTASLR
jgi:uncharacterized protein YcbK (DUF882 family)